MYFFSFEFKLTFWSFELNTNQSAVLRITNCRASSSYVFHLIATTPDQRAYSVSCEPWLMTADDEDAFMSAVRSSSSHNTIKRHKIMTACMQLESLIWNYGYMFCMYIIGYDCCSRCYTMFNLITCLTVLCSHSFNSFAFAYLCDYM